MRRENVDLFMIPCAINANNAEVTLGNIAIQRAQSPEVKQFAEEAVKDHTAWAKRFEQLKNSMTQNLHPQNPSNTPTAATLFELHQQIDQACLADAERDLQQQSGRDFDLCYMGSQIGMHQHAAAAVSVLKNFATSPDLKKDLDEFAQVVSQHLDHAKKIEKGLMQQGENQNRGPAPGSSTTR